MTSSAESLRKELSNAGRALSTSTVLFHQLVAQQLQLNDSDHKCLDLLLRDGEMTAGELAHRSGFTTGAVTGIVNRLEAQGLVRRANDKADLRRVVLRPVSEKIHARMWPLLQPMIQKLAALHGRYRVTELKLLLDYSTRCARIMEECAAELAAQRDESKSSH